ncbi:hypothetical protein P691DRAFT_788348 [Macrolepiota fuliginosa MF-IS2]|uniref:Uncharacterized protein n=1 Tax=Macrolepiota fuliginosa MF-IS2 TaxID=1400762 RepID=A0A9P6BZ07_9AGAR|nr:hypothetical protein P691DRAFT_788348 [Macrolepiota fuliginosa MF-IS2]
MTVWAGSKTKGLVHGHHLKNIPQSSYIKQNEDGIYILNVKYGTFTSDELHSMVIVFFQVLWVSYTLPQLPSHMPPQSPSHTPPQSPSCMPPQSPSQPTPTLCQPSGLGPPSLTAKAIQGILASIVNKVVDDATPADKPNNCPGSTPGPSEPLANTLIQTTPTPPSADHNVEAIQLQPTKGKRQCNNEVPAATEQNHHTSSHISKPPTKIAPVAQTGLEPAKKKHASDHWFYEPTSNTNSSTVPGTNKCSYLQTMSNEHPHKKNCRARK